MAKLRIITNHGNITLQLDAKLAPKTVENFVEYARSGFYNDTLFHRVIPNFMIQGGGMMAGLRGKPTTRASIRNEAENGLKNKRGSVAMARTSDPHSATAQFFINLKDNDFLDHKAPNTQGWGYCVFGNVTEGMDVVDAIAKLRTGSKGMHQDVPLDDVVTQKVELLED
jgi:peptidyl-prolyl cis-trans isomerase B (cyclophilin B)